MVNSKIIFSKNKIFLSGNVVGKSNQNPDIDPNKIILTKRISDTSNIIGVTQKNLANNITINGPLKKISFHRDVQPKIIYRSTGIKTENPRTYYPHSNLTYIDNNGNYLIDGSVNYYLNTNNSTDIRDFSNNFTMYYNYGLQQLSISETELTRIDLRGFFDFSLSNPDISNNFDICFLYINDLKDVSIEASNNTTGEHHIDININHPLRPKGHVYNDQINQGYSNQIILIEKNNSKKKYYLDLEYIFYDSTSNIYYLAPYLEELSFNVTDSFTIPQLTSQTLNITKYLSGPSKSFSIFDLNLVAINKLSNPVHFMHYNNKIIRFTNLDPENNLATVLKRTGRTDVQLTKLIRALEGNARNIINDNSSSIVFPAYTFTRNNDIGELNLTAISLNRFFVGTLQQSYKVFQNLPDVEIISNTFTITYNIICNPKLCPVLGFPDKREFTSSIGSMGSFRMQFSKALNTATKRKGKKTKFIKQNL